MPVYKLPKGFDLPPPRLCEGDAADPVAAWFKDFKDRYGDVRKTWPANFMTMPVRDFDALFQDMFPAEVKRRMRLVGKGTTRAVFISDANVCYKFQYNDFNNQSASEIAEALAWPDLSCFPRLLDWSQDGLAMAYEVAVEPTREEFVRTFTQGPAWISDRLREYAEEGESRMLDVMLGSGVLNAPQERVVRDLMKFQREAMEKQGRCLKDIDHADNWGKMYRGGEQVLLVTDFGL